MRQLTVHIPKAQWPEFTTLLDAPVDDIHRLADYISSAVPLPDIEDLVEACASTGLSQDSIESILSVGINLNRLQRNLDKPLIEVLDQVGAVLDQSGFPEWKERRATDWQERQQVLGQLLAMDGALEIMAKVRELLYDFQCVFLNSCVLTDVRYVYGHEATEIRGGLISHSLNLEYVEGSEIRQLHLTLSSADVKKLVAQLRRGQTKTVATEALLANMGIPELTPARNL